MLSWAGRRCRQLDRGRSARGLGGLGWMATRIIFKVEEITEAAMKLYEKQRKQATEAELDELAAQLRQQGDARTQDSLTLLRSLREDFQEISERPDVVGRSGLLRDRVAEVFAATVDQLRETVSLAQLLRKLSGPARDARSKRSAKR